MYQNKKGVKPILSIDFETSDLPDNGGQAIEFAAGLVDPGTMEFIKTNPIYHTFIKLKPGVVMSPEAFKCHGITTEYLEEHGIEKKDAAIGFLKFLELHGFNLTDPKQMQLLGQNIGGFDVPVLKNLIGLEYFKIFHYKYIDTQPWADLINRAHEYALGFEAIPFKHPESGAPSVSQETQAHCFGLDTSGAHGALFDIKTNVAIFKLHIVSLGADLVNSRAYHRIEELERVKQTVAK